MNPKSILPYIATLSPDTLRDIADEQWNDAMTDALYAACGASTAKEMAGARHLAKNYASDILRALRDAA